MSDSRKSSRSRKTVCYSKFGEDDSDDDFARATPPPKKSKVEKKDKLSKTNRSKESKEKNSAVTNDDNNRADRCSKRTERISPDDKAFDRELQLALELSMHDSEELQPNEAPSNHPTCGKTKDIEAQIHLTAPKTENSSASDSTSEVTDNKENIVVMTTKPPPSFQEPDDEIVFVESLDEDEVVGGRRKRKAAKEAVAKQRKMAGEECEETEDTEFTVDCTAAISSDEFDSGDADSDYEEFTASKKKTKRAVNGKGKSPKSAERGRKAPAIGKKGAGDSKPKPTPKRTAITSKTNKPSTPVTPLARRPQAAGPVSTPITPLARRPQAAGPVRGFTPPGSLEGNKRATLPSPLPVKRTTWSSPSSSNEANPLGGVKLVSPNQHIRLGLSRNIRIKPLHPNAKAI
ncbi:uncharacterized protein [Asterias amurensis]|uniref:uncharacterized protein n=1 Tax=Asterias amurensis TaxID=7602 RepID=UPI003AB8E4C0